MFLAGFVLLAGAIFAAGWTLDFAGCPLIARESELGRDTFNLQRAGITCVNGAMRPTACGSHVNLGGPFFDTNNHNLSIAITFRASHPLPLFSPLLTIYPKNEGEGTKPLIFGLYNHPPSALIGETDEDWVSQVIRVHYFSLAVPADLLASGFCDRVLGESIVIMLSTQAFRDVMDEMLDPGTAGDAYTVRIMFMDNLQHGESHAYTTIQRNGVMGTQVYYSNITPGAFRDSIFHKYRVGGSAGASYEIGCNGTGPGSALEFMRISVNSSVYAPPLDF